MNIPSLPEWMESDPDILEAWEEWVLKRKKAKCPLDTPRAIRRALKRLQGFRDNGHDIAKILDNAINGGPRGVWTDTHANEDTKLPADNRHGFKTREDWEVAQAAIEKVNREKVVTTVSDLTESKRLKV